MRIAVYTSMFPSSYQLLVPPVYINNDIDYLCFTDGPLKPHHGIEYESPPWQLRIVERRNANARTESRIYKFLPHIYLPEYDWTVYQDSNVKLRVDPVEVVEAVKDTGYSMMLLSHPWRDCLYEEIQFNRALKAGPKQKNSDAQRDRYRAEGFPEHNGMAACTFIVRDNRDPEIQRFGDFWWEEYVRAKNPRDQCCFEYCIWKTGTKYFHMNHRFYRWSSNEFFVIGQTHETTPNLNLTYPLLGEADELDEWSAD